MQAIRIFIIIMAVYLFFMASCSSNSDNSTKDSTKNNSTISSTVAIEKSNSIFDISTSSDGQIYAADKEFINIYDAGGKIIKKNEYKGFITNLVISNNEIFAFDILNKMLIMTNDEGDIWKL